MYERFTERARRVVVLAQEEARQLHHSYIGSEHILLGLIREGGDAASVLDGLGVTLGCVRKQVEEDIGLGESSPSGRIPFTPRAKKVLELSVREALLVPPQGPSESEVITPAHILLGLLRDEDAVGCQVLVKLGVELADIRRAVLQEVRAHSPAIVEQGREDVDVPNPQPTVADLLEMVESIASDLAAREGQLQILLARVRELVQTHGQALEDLSAQERINADLREQLDLSEARYGALERQLARFTEAANRTVEKAIEGIGRHPRPPIPTPAEFALDAPPPPGGTPDTGVQAVVSANDPSVDRSRFDGGLDQG